VNFNCAEKPQIVRGPQAAGVPPENTSARKSSLLQGTLHNDLENPLVWKGKAHTSILKASKNRSRPTTRHKAQEEAVMADVKKKKTRYPPGAGGFAKRGEARCSKPGPEKKSVKKTNGRKRRIIPLVVHRVSLWKLGNAVLQPGGKGSC